MQCGFHNCTTKATSPFGDFKNALCPLHREFMSEHRKLYKTAVSPTEEIHLRYIVLEWCPQYVDRGHVQYLQELALRNKVYLGTRCIYCKRRNDILYREVDFTKPYDTVCIQCAQKYGDLLEEFRIRFGNSLWECPYEIVYRDGVFVTELRPEYGVEDNIPIIEQ